MKRNHYRTANPKNENGTWYKDQAGEEFYLQAVEDKPLLQWVEKKIEDAKGYLGYALSDKEHHFLMAKIEVLEEVKQKIESLN